MTDTPRDTTTFSLENPPGTEWVLLRSGGAPAETNKGQCPQRWLVQKTGHIFVRHAETSEWLSYDRQRRVFIETPQQWQGFANDIWNRAQPSFLAEEGRRAIESLDVFDVNNRVEWGKFFKWLNPYSRTRAEIFPDGTKKKNMSEADIIAHIQQNHSSLLAGGVDPLEIPELIDQELRPLCCTINQTTWGRSNDGCSGHPASEEGHTKTGYGETYLRVILDLNHPSANRYIDEVQKVSGECRAAHLNLQVSLDQREIISSTEGPRIVYHTVRLNITPPQGIEENVYFDSEACHQISADFFRRLNARASSIER